MVEVQQQQELREMLRSAQAALEEGRPQEALAACQHALRHYPDAITALRLLGEACLEAGRSDDAARAFDKALSIDPHNVLVRVGLGVIAEDRGEDERAIAQFRLAWEIEPTLPQLRGELVRLYRKRYGAGGRLRLTRLALANLHRRNDELPRAISQLRQLHEEDPSRPEITLALAEVLWRHEEDDDAAFLCQSLLAERPRTARALLMLASIQGDNEIDSGQGVDALLAAARGYDPDLTLTGELIALRPSETLLAFAGDVPTVPPFDPATAPAFVDDLLSQGADGGTPMMRWEDIASGLTSETASIRSATKLGTVNAVPTAAVPMDDQVDELFAAIDRELATASEQGTGPLPEVLSFDLPEAEAAGPATDWAEPIADGMMPAPDEPSAVERLTANWDNIDNELAAARPNDEVPIGMTGMLSALGDFDADLVPFDVDKASEEGEETLIFDPSKFSLPPLDDEDDDDLALELGGAEDEAISPFSLEAAGVRPMSGGKTFADLVQRQEAPAPSVSEEHDEAPDVDRGAVAAAAAIFATREFSSLPEDQLLELQAGLLDTNTLAERPASVPITSPIAGEARPTLDDGAAPESLVVEEAPRTPGVDDTLVASAQPASDAEDAAANAEAGESPRGAFSTADLDVLLSTSSPRAVTPPAEHYPVDATRPLLTDEVLDQGGAASSDEDFLVSKLPAAPADEDEPGMDRLFDRLRYRKQERVQTGELLVNRRLQPSATPGADTGEIAGPLPAPPTASPPPAEEAAEETGAPAVAPDAAALLADQEGADQVGAAEAAPAETVAPPDAESPVAAAHDDSWLTALVGGDVAVADDWAVESAMAGAPLPSAIPAAGTTPAAPEWDSASPVVASGEIPEHPAPPSSRWSEPAAAGAMPHWGDEAIDEPVAALASAQINGRHGAAVLEPHESVVMRVRTPGSRPLAPAAVAAKVSRPTLRQTDQLAILNAMVDAEPENHFARLTLAVAYVSGGLPEQALNEYRRLIKQADDLVPEVVERLKEMIADGGVPARTHRVLGDAYMKLGQFDLAMAEFQRALSSRPRAAK